MSLVKTEHIHIVRDKKICGGRPIVRGTRTSVQSIIWYYKDGLTPEEIKEELPHLSLSQIYDAVSFYHDHKNKIEKEIEASRMENIIKNGRVKLDKRGFIKR